MLRIFSLDNSTINIKNNRIVEIKVSTRDEIKNIISSKPPKIKSIKTFYIKKIIVY